LFESLLHLQAGSRIGSQADLDCSRTEFKRVELVAGKELADANPLIAIRNPSASTTEPVKRNGRESRTRLRRAVGLSLADSAKNSARLRDCASVKSGKS